MLFRSVEAVAKARLVAAVGEGGVMDDTRTDSGVALHAFNQPEQFFSTKERDATVEYAAGWDESMFAREWKEGEVQPVALPVGLMARLRLSLGDMILVYGALGGPQGSYVVAGMYAGLVCDDAEPILFPASALKLREGNSLLYSVAEFVIDTTRNRELPEFRARMETFFARGNVGIVDLELLFWDGELTQVVEPLEKNLLLMSILYPVTVAVSTLIAAGLAALLLFQAAREAAIMRVLGTTKSRARVMLCGEQLSLCLMGLLLGLAMLVVLRQDASAVLAGPALVCAGLYLAGAFFGAVFSAISVTNRMPLELLQVKE